MYEKENSLICTDNTERELEGVAIQQPVVKYKEFKIALPVSQEKRAYYLVIEPMCDIVYSQNAVTANLETKNSKIVAPDEKLNVVFEDYFGTKKLNSRKVASKEFLEEIHPGKIYSISGEDIWWKELVKEVLKDYIYAENSDATDINGYGFFAATFINEKTKKAVIAYRGTEFPKANDLVTDFGLLLRVFKPAQMKLANKYYKYIVDKYKGYEIVLTGHSLGGALACSVTFENLGNKQITYMPGGIEYTSYPNSPVSVSFNGAVGLALDFFPKDVEDDMIYAEANYVNYVSARSEWFNDKVVGLGAEHSQLKRKYVQDCINATGVKGEPFPVHSLSGFVIYENEQYKISPLDDYYFESEGGGGNW